MKTEATTTPLAVAEEWFAQCEQRRAKAEEILRTAMVERHWEEAGKPHPFQKERNELAVCRSYAARAWRELCNAMRHHPQPMPEPKRPRPERTSARAA